MLIFVDVEATCWERKYKKDLNEIIEIGIVLCSSDKGIISTFQSFVKPTINYKISKFCKELTKIEQKWINEAEGFHFVSLQIENWFSEFSSEPFSSMAWFSWGELDPRVIQQECFRHKIDCIFGGHMDMQKMYSMIRGKDNVSVNKAMQNEGIESYGPSHRAINDATNIAIIADKIF